MRPDEIKNRNIFDAHCHLDFCLGSKEGLSFIKDISDNLEGAYSFTCTPSDYLVAKAAFEPFSNICVGLGLHPWYVPEDKKELIECLEMFKDGYRTYKPLHIGEVGLDFSAKHISNAQNQIYAFEAICKTIDKKADVLSIHAVLSVEEILAILKKFDLPGNVPCVFHRFGGSPQQLREAFAAGCYVSWGSA
ncbi:MAG: TatD family hydrolase, partial [Eggerthellaceae bacterium]|nr:TatD family hydrolase [Eggerthellaceae bacterium]